MMRSYVASLMTETILGRGKGAGRLRPGAEGAAGHEGLAAAGSAVSLSAS